MPLLTQANSTTVPRATLVEAFPDPRLRSAIEQALQTANDTPDAVNAFADATVFVLTPTGVLPNELVVQGGPGVTFDTSTPNVVVINVVITIDAATMVSGLTNADDDAAALAAGVPLGGIYRNGSVLQFRVT